MDPVRERSGMRRRTLLTTGAAALAATAGCLGENDDPGGTSDGTDDPATDDPTTEPPTDDPTTEPPTDDTYATFAPPEDAAHRLYVENLDDESHRMDVQVTALETGETVLAGRFEAPDGRGIEFPEIAARDAVYGVQVALVDAGPAAAFQWNAQACPEDSEAPNGSRNGSVRVAEDAADLSFVVDACDALVAGTEVSTGPPGNFALDGYATPAVTVDSPDRGCAPLLSADPVGEQPGEDVVAFDDLPENRRAEFEGALEADRYYELAEDSEYGFWVDEAQYVRYDGDVYAVGVAVC